MKQLKILGILILMTVSLGSCDLLFDLFDTQPAPSKYVVYNLALGFQDASGNDLVKGIKLDDYATVNRNSYELYIIASDSCKSWYDGINDKPDPDIDRPRLGMYQYNGCCYLTNIFRVPINDCPQEEILTYKLKCLDVFGDEEVHEMVTYWDIPKVKGDNDHIAKCFLVKFDGTEITPIPTDKTESAYYAVTIILN